MPEITLLRDVDQGGGLTTGAAPIVLDRIKAKRNAVQARRGNRQAIPVNAM